MYNFAFAGFRHGHIFGMYDKAIKSENVNIVAAFEEDEETRKSCQNDRNINFTDNDYDEMLAKKDIDVVCVGDYYGIRGQRVIKALEAGKNVFADKPICTSLCELDRIEQLCKQKNLKVGCMLDMRYYGWANTAKKYFETGKLGNVNNIIFGGEHPLMYGSRPQWYFEKGKHGGTINDISIHGLDIINYMTGLKMESIIGARCWNAYAKEEPDFKDCGQFMLKMSNGAGLLGDVSYATPNSFGYGFDLYWHFELWCDNGVMLINNRKNQVTVALDGKKELEILEQVPMSDDDYLTEFLKELNGESTHTNTQTVTAVSRDVLKIQEFADNLR